MAGQTTVLTEFSDNGNSRTSTLPDHTTLKPRLVIQKRKVPTNQAQSAEMTISVIYATTDVEGAVLAPKVAFDVTVRYPASGQAADVSAALAVFRDIVQGDEFAASVSTQNWL